MGQTPSKGSSLGGVSSSSSSSPEAGAAGSLSQVLGLVEAPGDGGGARLQQHRRPSAEGFANSWQLEVIRQTKTIHR